MIVKMVFSVYPATSSQSHSQTPSTFARLYQVCLCWHHLPQPSSVHISNFVAEKSFFLKIYLFSLDIYILER